jgi:hypothetical protein
MGCMYTITGNGNRKPAEMKGMKIMGGKIEKKTYRSG